MLKQEADDVIERIRDDLKRHGVLIGYDPEFTTPEFGCDLDTTLLKSERIRTTVC